MTNLSDPIYHDDVKAREYLESLRWADGRFCPHCGETERTSPIEGESNRPGMYYCRSCKGQFTVTIGTVYERSHIPLHKWVMAMHLMS
ncbi:MAG: transposase, partial [Planctomycetota bacterium]